MTDPSASPVVEEPSAMDSADRNVAARPEDTFNTLLLNLQSATHADELLRLALVELAQAFGAERGAVRLGQPNTDNAESARPIHD